MAKKPSPLLDTRLIYCGDNHEQLPKLPSGCIDLIYIDPPFNSNRNYEVFWGETKEKRAFADRHASTQAYIEYMRPRCVELARVLKKSGSFYYHCDWHASHYVKVMLDQIFGENNFRNEIVWKRTSGRKSERQYGRIHDTIFFYTGSADWTWNPTKLVQTVGTIKGHDIVKIDGIPYRLSDLSGPGQGPPRTFNGGLIAPPKGRHWMFDQPGMDAAWAKGDIHINKKGVPRLRIAVSNLQEIDLGDVWVDIEPLNSSAAERLGYPTQKPLALLERIIKASSKENDIVLDAFCGCGTALVAAQNLKRQWIGIDISPTACRVMAKRLRDVCYLPEDEREWRRAKGFVVRNLPWTVEKLRIIPPFEFENWAVNELGGIANKVQVGDLGIDGRIYPVSAMPKKRGISTGELEIFDEWYPIQVKQKDRAGRPDIDSFETAMRRADRKLGYFVSFDFSKDALDEIDRFERTEGRRIKAYTVQALLDMDTSTESRRTHAQL